MKIFIVALVVCLSTIKITIAQSSGFIVYAYTSPTAKPSFVEMYFSQDRFVYRRTDETDSLLANFSIAERKKKLQLVESKLAKQEIGIMDYNKFSRNYTYRQANIGSNLVLISSIESEKRRICSVDTMKMVVWQLIEKLDTVEGRICNMATGIDPNTGNKLIAWYDAKIATPAAPFQFGGLPGLLLKVKNISSGNTMKVMHLKYPANADVSLFKVCEGCNLVSLSKSIEIQNAENEKIRNFMQRLKGGEKLTTKDFEGIKQ